MNAPSSWTFLALSRMSTEEAAGHFLTADLSHMNFRGAAYERMSPGSLEAGGLERSSKEKKEEETLRTGARYSHHEAHNLPLQENTC